MQLWTMAGEVHKLSKQPVQLPVPILLMYKACRNSYLVKWERNDSYSVYIKKQFIIPCIFSICIGPIHPREAGLWTKLRNILSSTCKEMIHQPQKPSCLSSWAEFGFMPVLNLSFY